MKNAYLLFFLLLLAGCNSSTSDNQDQHDTAATGDETTRNGLTQAETDEGWMLLSGDDPATHWRGYGRPGFPESGWVVKDGELVVEKAPDPRPEGFGGDIITREKYGNFELQLEFMLTDTANSGIFYFVSEEEGIPIWHYAPEYQLLDDKTYLETGQTSPDGLHRSGGNYDMEACGGDYLKPVGEWNTARIVHRDGHVEHWLNGNKCLEYTVGSGKWKEQFGKSKFKDYENYAQAREGHIGLQDHDHEVRFRNIKIKNL